MTNPLSLKIAEFTEAAQHGVERPSYSGPLAFRHKTQYAQYCLALSIHRILDLLAGLPQIRGFQDLHVAPALAQTRERKRFRFAGIGNEVKIGSIDDRD